MAETITVRVDESMRSVLDAAVKRSQKSKSELVRDALAIHLDDILDYEEAVAGWQEMVATGERIYSDAEMRAQLGLDN